MRYVLYIILPSNYTDTGDLKQYIEGFAENFTSFSQDIKEAHLYRNQKVCFKDSVLLTARLSAMYKRHIPVLIEEVPDEHDVTEQMLLDIKRLKDKYVG